MTDSINKGFNFKAQEQPHSLTVDKSFKSTIKDKPFDKEHEKIFGADHFTVRITVGSHHYEQLADKTSTEYHDVTLEDVDHFYRSTTNFYSERSGKYDDPVSSIVFDKRELYAQFGSDLRGSRSSFDDDTPIDEHTTRERINTSDATPEQLAELEKIISTWSYKKTETIERFYNENNPGLLLGLEWKNVSVEAGVVKNSFGDWAPTVSTRYSPDKLSIDLPGSQRLSTSFAMHASYYGENASFVDDLALDKIVFAPSVVFSYEPIAKNVSFDADVTPAYLGVSVKVSF